MIDIGKNPRVKGVKKPEGSQQTPQETKKGQ